MISLIAGSKGLPVLRESRWRSVPLPAFCVVILARLDAGISGQKTVLWPRFWQRSQQALLNVCRVEEELRVCKAF